MITQEQFDTVKRQLDATFLWLNEMRKFYPYTQDFIATGVNIREVICKAEDNLLDICDTLFLTPLESVK